MMQFRCKNAEVFVPDGQSRESAFKRTAIMGIAAHQDDIEILAFHGILQCSRTKGQWFTAVVCTDGSGSPRVGRYANFSNEQMQEVRWQEQRDAATKGRYSAVVQLKCSSAEIKDPKNRDVIEDIRGMLLACRPKVVYTHNPADKHDTHVAVMIKLIQAMRALPEGERPEKLYGVEIWRDLDWLPDADKVVLDVSGGENLASLLLSVFDSQIAGGKRYDLATLGRWRANATYQSSHAVDTTEHSMLAMDLTPLMKSSTQDVMDYVMTYIEKFRQDVKTRLEKFRAV